jgi:hypothetical protein
MKKSIAMTLAALTLTLTACEVQNVQTPRDAYLAQRDAEAWSEAKRKVVKLLRDPDSAQFKCGYVGEKESKLVVRGQVNAKNAYGGYAGYKSFTVEDGSVTWEPIDICWGKMS